MNIIKTKLIKIIYYTEPKEILYEVEENINLETLLWECGRSDGTDITNTQPCIIDGMSQRHYEHFSQFKYIVNGSRRLRHCRRASPVYRDASVLSAAADTTLDPYRYVWWFLRQIFPSAGRSDGRAGTDPNP